MEHLASYFGTYGGAFFAGLVTEILVQNEEMVEFGKGLVRIK